MIILGDSWAAGWNCENNSVAGGWPEILGIPKEKNFTIPGSTAKQWADGDITFPDIFNEYVVIGIGGNDLIDILGKSEEVRHVKTMELFGHLVCIYKQIYERRASNLLAFEYANPTTREDVQVYLDALNTHTRFLANGRTLRTQDFLKPEHFRAGDIHTNLAGQKLMAEKIIEITEGAKK